MTTRIEFTDETGKTVITTTEHDDRWPEICERAEKRLGFVEDRVETRRRTALMAAWKQKGKR